MQFIGLTRIFLGTSIRYFDRDVECIFKFFGKRYVTLQVFELELSSLGTLYASGYRTYDLWHTSSK